jgi:hypothetical protein
MLLLSVNTTYAPWELDLLKVIAQAAERERDSDSVFPGVRQCGIVVVLVLGCDRLMRGN